MTFRSSSEATRRRLLRAGFRQLQRRGFQMADLQAIQKEAGVTKGALYYHFQSKRGLGFAIVDEVLHPWIIDRWLRPVENAVDPLEALTSLADWGERTVTRRGLALGCPLNTLAQELAAVDEGFRRRLAAIYREWRDGLARALARAQQQRLVRADVDTQTAATFIVAAWEGSIGLAKSQQDVATLHHCRQGLERYLETLKP